MGSFHDFYFLGPFPPPISGFGRKQPQNDANRFSAVARTSSPVVRRSFTPIPDRGPTAHPGRPKRLRSQPSADRRPPINHCPLPIPYLGPISKNQTTARMVARFHNGVQNEISLHDTRPVSRPSPGLPVTGHHERRRQCSTVFDRSAGQLSAPFSVAVSE
jgi:hypothetical protein